MHFVTNLFPVTGVQNLSKSVKICQSYCKSLPSRFYSVIAYNTALLPELRRYVMTLANVSRIFSAGSRKLDRVVAVCRTFCGVKIS